MNWWQKNWDKVITAFFSVVVAGLVGYFLAKGQIQADISQLRQDLAQIKQRVGSNEAKLKLPDENHIKIVSIQAQLPLMQKQIDSIESKNSSLDALRALEERKTFEHLENILKKYGKKP